jgi:hypothetical protein
MIMAFVEPEPFNVEGSGAVKHRRPGTPRAEFQIPLVSPSSHWAYPFAFVRSRISV